MLKRLALLIPPLRRLHEDRNRYAEEVSRLSAELTQHRQEYATLMSEVDEITRRLSDLQISLTELDKADFPVYFRGGRPYFASQIVRAMPRIIVVTIPKSGIYLVGVFLKNLGFVDSGVHLDDVGFSDYRDKTISAMVSRYREFRRVYPLDKSVRLLGEGQFAVGHLGYCDQNVTTLSDIQIIFVAREVRHAMVSMMRWFCRTGRGVDSDLAWKEISENKKRMVVFLNTRGESLISWFSSCAGWQTHGRVLPIRFEQITGEMGRFEQSNVAFSLVKHCGIGLRREEALSGLMEVLGKPTKTWSGKQSVLKDYWSDDAEKLFQSLGGSSLNIRLGYRE